MKPRIFKGRSVVSLLFLWGSLIHPVLAQKFVNEFLTIGVGARSHGMSGSVIANTTDAAAGFWNPAGLAELSVPMQLSAMHANWFGGIANYDFASVAKKTSSDRPSAVGLTVIRLGIDNIPNTLNLIGPDGSVDYTRVTNFSASDFAGIVSYGSRLAQNKLSIGGSLKVIHRSIGSFGKAWGFGADIGLRYAPSSRFSFGIVAKDVTTTFTAWSFRFTEEEKRVFASTGNVIPVSSTELALPRLILGVAWKGEGKSFTWLAEADCILSTDGTRASLFSANRVAVSPSLGVEIGLFKRVFVRAGGGNIQSVLNPALGVGRKWEFQPTVGMGLRLGRLHVDYALANVGSVGGVLVSHIFSLSLDIIPRQ